MKNSAKHALDILSKLPDRSITHEDFQSFIDTLRINLDDEAKAELRKKLDPDEKGIIPGDKAFAQLTEFLKDQEWVGLFKTEAEVLSSTKTDSFHAEDFRYMLHQLGEEIPDSDIDDFIREALGKGDDMFSLQEFIDRMVGIQ